MDTVPPVVWALVGVAAMGIVATLVDLARHDVRGLPRWGWALVIALVQFPFGAIAYLVLGRVPRSEAPVRSSVPASWQMSPVPGTAHGDGGERVTASAGAPASARGRQPTVRPRVARDRGHGVSGVGTTSVRSSAAPIVSTNALRKLYGGTVALDDVDLIVPDGCTYGLIGPNGAGKTTLLGILAGLRRPSGGACTLAVRRRSVAVLADTPQFEPWLSAREVVDLARHLVAPELPTEAVIDALQAVGLADVVDRRCGGFSRGMLQRLGLACCLVGDPQLLLLDEPSSALDPAGRREVLDLIGRLARTRTVVLSTHILADVQQACDTVGVLDGGRLRFQGPLDALLARTGSAFDLHIDRAADELLGALRTSTWVTDVVERAPGHLRLVVSDAAVAERQVPRLLTDHGRALRSFNPATDLEAAFLELTT